ncbi:hypothetical protein HID58_016025, partial [Brassica napus]
RKMEIANTKWVAAAASIWIQSFTGASYTFGIYSSLLKSSQSYDQSTLDTVSVCKDIGANVGILSGLFYTAVASGRSGNGRFFSGPWVVIFVGLLQWFVGYGFIWMATSGVIERPPVAVMCFFMFLAGHCQPFFNTAIVVTAVRNFSDYGGTAVGIMKGYIGLSGAVLVQMYHIFCKGDPTNYLLLLAVVPSLLILTTMPFVRTYDTVIANDKKHLNGLSTISLIIVTYLMIVILVENIIGMSMTMKICSFTILVLLLASPLLVAVRAHREEKDRFMSLDFPVTEKTTLLDAPKLNPSPDVNVVMSNDMDVLQAIRTTNFWLLFTAMLCGMGSGLATVNNIRQVGESLRYSTVQLNSLVSLWSIWNFLGRFGSGYISDAYLHSHGWPRPVFMAITLTLMAIGHVVMASGLLGSLYIGSLIVGLAYGSQWALMPTITSEIFGIRHMGTIFYTISIASPVIGYLYDQVASVDDHSCYGNHCFSTSFVIMAAMAMLGSLVAFVLFLRTKKFYATLVAKRILKLTERAMERVNTKWVAAAASIWIQSFSGATYTFAIYSSILKSSQSYDQSTLDFVSVFKDIGGTLGIFSGLLYTAMASTPHGRGRGPWVVVFVGLVQWFLGFFFMWASVVGLIPKPPVAVMCLFVFLAGHSLPFFNTASVVTAARNFSDYGGTAVGIMQGFLGLSGAILIQLYHAVSGEGNPATFILLLAIVPTLVIFLTMPFVRVYETVRTSDKKHLDGLSVISLIIAAYLMLVITVQNVLGLTRSVQILSFVLVLLLLASPLLVAVRALREEKQMALDHPVLDTSVFLISPSSNIFPGESLRYSTVQLNSLVSLWSIWNFLGRFGAGYISDTFLHKHSWPRPVFMAITLGVMAVGHIVVASGLQGSLYVGSVLIGMAYGSQWSLMPTITSEIFGIRHMGTIYFTISIAGPVGSYLLSVKVIGYFYDKVASEVDNSCCGSQCFRTSFVIMASVALFGSLVASVLLFRTKKFYKKLVAKRSLK